MEFDTPFIVSFLVVCLVSSVCVSIGIGGGILYVPILGFLYKDVAQGVYLSKIAILVTSFLGSSYHIVVDITNLVKRMRSKRAVKDATELESQTNLEKGPAELPRIYFILAVSLVPWCIIGSYVGTTFHFFAKESLKYVVTSIVFLCFLLTLVKLYLIYRNRKMKARLDADNTHTEVELETEPAEDVMLEEVSKEHGPLYKIFGPYDQKNLHGNTKRLLSFLWIAVCLVLYYLVVRFERLPLTLVILISLGTSALFFSLKVMRSFRPPNFYKNRNKLIPEGGKKAFLDKVSGILDTGVHFLLLNTFTGFISGFFSGSVGTGSGIFMVPLLQYLNMAPISCTATSNFLTLVMSIATLSRFSLKVDLTLQRVLPIVISSSIGTLVSLLFIRVIIKDKLSSLFVNLTLIIFCAISIITTWTIRS